MTAFQPPEQLPSGVGIEGFCCGDRIVDDWVRLHSASARKRGTAVLYVVRSGDEIAGFYSLSTHAVARSEIHGGWFARNAPEQVPSVLLGMLGVDKRFKGMGLGASLLRDAIQNAMKVAHLAGARALIVDPSCEEAASFYEHFGFAHLPGTHRMALKLI